MRLHPCIYLPDIGEALGGVVFPEDFAHPAIGAARVELVVGIALHVVVVLEALQNVEHLGAGIVGTGGIAATGPRGAILPLGDPDGTAVVLQRVEIVGPLAGGPIAVSAGEVATLLHVVAMLEILRLRYCLIHERLVADGEPMRRPVALNFGVFW